MDGVRKAWADRIRSIRKGRGWDKPEMARRLAQAAGEARSSLPDHETLLSYVKRWERASVGISERYRMLYARAFSMDEDELFGGRSVAPSTGEPTTGGSADEFFSTAVSGRVGAEDADEVHRAIRRLYSIDDQYGGGRLRASVLNLLQGTQRLLRAGSIPSRSGAPCAALLAMSPNSRVGPSLRAATRWWEGITPPPPPQFTAERDGRTFAVKELAVAGSYRREGVGRCLHDALLERRFEERATLTVRPDAAPALAAYGSWGWSSLGAIRPDDQEITYVVMARSLP